MATTLEDCDRLLAAARAGGRILTIGHELRLSAQYGKVKALIDRGEIGTPSYLAFSLFRFPFRPGSGGWRYDAARVGSWILEEPVHFFDFTMWYFESLGDPLSVQALGVPRAGEAGMSNDLTVILRFPGQAHAVITETLAGFEYHQLLHVVGSEGAIRSWWSGAARPHPPPELRAARGRRGRREAETVPVLASGELVELEEQARQVVTAFARREALVSGEEARKRVAVCLAAERSLREGREGRVGALRRITKKLLLDHFVGSQEQRRWDGESERLRSSVVDDQLEPRGLSQRQLTRPSAIQDFWPPAQRPSYRSRIGSRRRT
jgi:myo-inositol 2-dehydrogenase/D-chiro-inositol 1-dehydrogenase